MDYFDNAMRPLEYMRPPGRRHDAVLADRARDNFAIRADAVSQALNGREFLIEDSFSGADILIGHSCFMATFTGLIEGFPVLEEYFARLQNRPAYQRAYEPAI